MNIVVCVKRVVATDSQVQPDAEGKAIDVGKVEFVLNPYDEYAVEEGLKTKEATGDGSVTVITLGSKDSIKELRTCLAMGVDKAVLLEHNGPLDAYSTAETLAKYLRQNPCDVIFMGKQAVDGDDSQVPARLATLLGYGCITEAKKVELADGTFTVERDIEGGREIVRCSVPVVISAHKGLNEPRYASLKGIMAAKKKPLEEVDAAAVAPATSIASLTLPPARPAGRILGEGADAVGALIDVLKNEAKVL